MSLLISVMEKFWKNNAKHDAENIASQTEPAGIERVYDIPYIDDGHRLHKLDVYYPEGTTGKLPVIVNIHGGGWMYGDKELNRMYNLNLAKRGFTVFSISYRLVPEVTVADQLREIAVALDFIAGIMKDYPCDCRNVMLCGDSAGGMLSAYEAAIISSEKLQQIFGTVAPSLKPTVLLLISPVSYMKNRGITSIYSSAMWGEDRRRRPIADYMNLDEIAPFASFPPTCLVTSSGDFIGRTQTREAAALLKNMGVDTKLLDYPKFQGENLPHVFSVLKPASEAGSMAIDETIDFYRCHMI